MNKQSQDGASSMDRRKFVRLMGGAFVGAGLGQAGIALAAAPSKSGAPFELQLLIDFYDDLLNSHFTEKTFREMMKIIRGWGITRIYWTGQSFASGLYDAETERRLDLNALLTFKEVGEFIPAASKYAHEAGLEFFVEFKPFDQFFPQLVPAVSSSWSELLVPENLNLFKTVNPWRKGIPALGGAWQMGTIFAEQHPQFLMARNMTGLREGIAQERIETIKFVKNDERPTGINKENLEIYVSEDNYRYKKYQGKYSFIDRVEQRSEVVRGVNLNRKGQNVETVRVITVSALDIIEPFLAFSTQRKEGKPDFANHYYKLIELYNQKGQPIPFTYGISRPETDQWYPPDLREKRFPDRGFPFDLCGNLSNRFSVDFIDTIGFLDCERRVVGLAKGKNPYICVLCPAYPEVRQYWLDQVKEFIDAGVDGVEFRWSAHQESIEQDAYGFNTPVVEEYKRRYGVDILREDFDRAKWRQLRGEYYTQFLRQATALLKRHDKQAIVDVTPGNDSDPNHPQYLNVYLDWERWFSFADGVSFKWVPLDPPASASVSQATRGVENLQRGRSEPRPVRGTDSTFRPIAKKYNIPTYYNVIPQIVFRRKNSQQIIDTLKELKEAGHKGFILYEAASFMKAKPDGTFDITYPELPNVIVPAVKAMNSAK